METNRSMTPLIIGVIVSLAIGAGIGYAMGNGTSETDNKKNTSNSSMTADSNDGVTVGGARMVRDKDIVDNAMQADNVKTVVSLVDMAGLVETLKGTGPFTVFAPNDGAFKKLDAATVASLQKPENVETLKTILTYHVVAGTYTSADLKAMAIKGESLTSVQGQMLMPIIEGGNVTLQDAMGNKVMIETADVISSNGVTHVIQNVLMPKQ